MPTPEMTDSKPPEGPPCCDCIGVGTCREVVCTACREDWPAAARARVDELIEATERHDAIMACMGAVMAAARCALHYQGKRIELLEKRLESFSVGSVSIADMTDAEFDEQLERYRWSRR